MAIKKYTENGRDFWKVYVHVRGERNRHKRVQRYVSKLESENEARLEEKRLLKEATKEMHRNEGRGLEWEEVVTRWEMTFKYDSHRSISDRSFETYLSTIHAWTKSWNKRPATELNRADARELIRQMQAKGLSYTYQKKVKNIINKVFDWGMEEGLIFNGQSPLRGITLERGEEKVPEILSLEEIKRFLTAAQAVSHPWYPIWATAILTGMRSGELHALSWEQVDLEKNIILVDRSFDSNMKTVGPTKGRYWRTVPISKDLRRLLMDLRVRPNYSDGHHVLPRHKEWDNGDQAISLKNFLKSIGLKPVKFHALRACFATQMLANGVTAPVVMKIGGWKKMSTMDIYLRLAGVDIKGATECLNFVPGEITFGDNVVQLFKEGGQ